MGSLPERSIWYELLARASLVRTDSFGYPTSFVALGMIDFNNIVPKKEPQKERKTMSC